MRDGGLAALCCGAQSQDAQRAYRPSDFIFIKGMIVHTTLSLGPLVSLLAGVLILLVPRMLNYIVAIYLIIFGLLGIFGDVHFR